MTPDDDEQDRADMDPITRMNLELLDAGIRGWPDLARHAYRLARTDLDLLLSAGRDWLHRARRRVGR